MEREKIHKILDLVLDIAEGGMGVDGFPFVDFTVSNYPVFVEVYTMDSGFKKGGPVDGQYGFEFHGNSGRKYEDCVRHLEELKAKRKDFSGEIPRM